jgi:hypothetical protein
MKKVIHSISADVSEEYGAYIFRIEDQTRQDSIIQADRILDNRRSHNLKSHTVQISIKSLNRQETSSWLTALLN